MTIYRNFNKFQASYNEDISFNVADSVSTTLPNSLNQYRPKRIINVEHMMGNQIAGGLNIAKRLVVGNQLVVGDNMTVLGNQQVDRNLDVSGDMTIGGDLTVMGNTYFNNIEETNTVIKDKIITIGEGAQMAGRVAQNSGIGFEVAHTGKGLEQDASNVYVENKPLFAYESSNRFAANRLIALQEDISLREFKDIIDYSNNSTHVAEKKDRDVVLAPIMYVDDRVANVGTHSNNHEIGWNKLKNNKLLVINESDFHTEVSGNEWGFVQLDLAHDDEQPVGQLNTTTNGMVDVSLPAMFTVVNNTSKDVEITLPHTSNEDVDEHYLFHSRNRRLAHPGHNVYVTTYAPTSSPSLVAGLSGEAAPDMWSGESLVTTEIYNWYNTNLHAEENNDTTLTPEKNYEDILSKIYEDVSGTISAAATGFAEWDRRDASGVDKDNGGTHNHVLIDFSFNYADLVDYSENDMSGVLVHKTSIKAIVSRYADLSNNYKSGEERLEHAGNVQNVGYRTLIPSITGLYTSSVGSMCARHHETIETYQMQRLTSLGKFVNECARDVEYIENVMEAIDISNVNAKMSDISNVLQDIEEITEVMTTVHDEILAYVQNVTNDTTRSNAIMTIHNELLGEYYGPDVMADLNEEQEDCRGEEENLLSEISSLTQNLSDVRDNLNNEIKVDVIKENGKVSDQLAAITEDISGYVFNASQAWMPNQLQYNEYVVKDQKFRTDSEDATTLNTESQAYIRSKTSELHEDVQNVIDSVNNLRNKALTHYRDVLEKSLNVRESLKHLLVSTNNLINEDEVTNTLKKIKDDDTLTRKDPSDATKHVESNSGIINVLGKSDENPAAPEGNATTGVKLTELTRSVIGLGNMEISN